MFSKPKAQDNAPQAFSTNNSKVREAVRGSGHTFSVIASDVEITGNLNAKVDLHVDGKIQGDVTCGSLVQGEGSLISGKVTAQTARLSGQVDGSIEAGELIIEASARIHGDVIYENLTIAPGGKVEGKFKHKSSAGAPNIHRTTVNVAKATDPLILNEEAKVA